VKIQWAEEIEILNFCAPSDKRADSIRADNCLRFKCLTFIQ